MPTKKKKKASTPTREHEINTVERDVVVEFLSLTLRGGSSKQPGGPRITLTSQDASALDVLPGEEIILVCRDTTLPRALIAVADVHSENSRVTFDSSSSGKKRALTNGNALMTSSCWMNDLMGQGVTLDSATDATTLPSSPVVSSKDQTLLSTPPSTPLHQSATVSACIVARDSQIGKRIARLILTDADRVVLHCPNSATVSIGTAHHIIAELFRAYYINSYLRSKQTLVVSFQGKPVALIVSDIAGCHQSLEARMDSITLNGNANDDAMLSSGAKELLDFVQKNMPNLQLLQCTYATKIDVDNSATQKCGHHVTSQALVVGLDDLLERVRSLLLKPIIHPEHYIRQQRPAGVLLHGPAGVGKSCLAKQIAHDMKAYCEVHFVNCIGLQLQTSIVGQAERYLMKYFEFGSHERKQRRLLVLDDVHLICPKRGDHHSAGTDQLASTLLALLDGTTGRGEDANYVAVLAVTSNPSMLDPALRRPGRLDTEVEVPIPDSVATRAEILRFHVHRLHAFLPNATDDTWTALGKLAKGCNGADCMLAVKEAIRGALQRMQVADASERAPSPIILTMEDLRTAIGATKPSIIKSITVEIPKVEWSMIGGMDHVKQALREAIELPLTHAALFAKLNVPPPRGILLYGPPGCSKTLLARALATQGQMNFLAVKGPELLSKWLGESERALASLFRRARLASPAIIFFDEMDAIASHRGQGDSSGSGRLLSQLLTELDGISHYTSSSSSSTAVDTTRQRVVVVGATNRPDLLDSALVRPGRMDRMIYVGIPDAASRAQIFQLSLANKASSADVDIAHLASDEISHGFSGAEIVAICRDAALLALEESEDMMNALPAIAMKHITQAAQGMKRQITPDMLDFYTSFSRQGHAAVSD